MNLPRGIRHWPGHTTLIARDEQATIEIDSREPGNQAYEIDGDQDFNSTVAPFLWGDWEEFDRLFKLRGVGGNDAVYSRAEHAPTPEVQKPNITVMCNLVAAEHSGLPGPLYVLGCSMGETLEPDPLGFRIQEVVEFLSFGALVLDFGKGRVELWAAQPGDKVAVPAGCHKTLYNLGDEKSPLITLDLVRRGRGIGGKMLDRERGDRLAPRPPAGDEGAGRKEDLRAPFKACGPILLVHYDDAEVVVTFNRLWINNHEYDAGVRLSTCPDAAAREIRIARGARLDLGRFLYEQLTQKPEVSGRFARLGMTVRQALPEVVLRPLPPGEGHALHVSIPLAEAADSRSETCRYFFPEVAAPGGSLAAKEIRRKPVTGGEKLDRPLVVVVEGAGDWVTEYRKHFVKVMERTRGGTEELRVVYADDTRWRPPPKWADEGGLASWEVYLDKADPEELARYLLLAPDAVFVVTPDFTHSETALRWLGKTPMVFVEKPFDSRIEHIDELLHTRGQLQPPTTTVRGLDHYQFYALPVAEKRREISQHLNGLREVRFFLAEAEAIKPERLRSLQHGLTLDLLPHLIALLTYFGSVASIDEIAVLDASSYGPKSFRNETASHLRFTFADRPGSRHRIPCMAVVGKGFSQDVKYLELRGAEGRVVRIDLNHDEGVKGYPKNAVLFLGDPGRERELHPVVDPYSGEVLHLIEPPEKCPRLDRARYERLIEDLMRGTTVAAESTLSLAQGWEIVRALDRIWWAVQRVRPWGIYQKGALDPFKYAEGTALRPAPLQTWDAKDQIIPTRQRVRLTRRRRELGEAEPLVVKTRGPLAPRIAKPLTRTTVHGLLEDLREATGGFPLTLVVHGWGTLRTDQFLHTLFELSALPTTDAVWLIPATDPGQVTPPAPREGSVVLDLRWPCDHRLYENLVVDLLFLPGEDPLLRPGESDEEPPPIPRFTGRARTLVLDGRSSRYEGHSSEAGVLGIPTYTWIGNAGLNEKEATVAPKVEEQRLLSAELDLIGQNLSHQALSLDRDFYRRFRFHIALRQEALERYPGHPTWTEDLIRLADRHQWPAWAILCLPRLFVLTRHGSDEEQDALVWKLIYDCIPPDQHFEVLTELCGGEILEVRMTRAARDTVAEMARRLEERLRPKSYWGYGRYDNEVLMWLGDLKEQMKGDEEALQRIRDVHMRFLANHRISGVPGHLPLH